jgi:lipopolysaccharide transport system ATP-binding protein
MTDVAIRAVGIGKEYRIGQLEGAYDTLRDQLSALALRGLGRAEPRPSRDKFWAVRDVSFKIDEGEVVGIIGRNGAGKTTLLRMLSRITEPTVGYADVSGRLGSLLEVGTGFHQELTGRENIFLNGAILGMRKREIARRLDDIIEFSGVEKFIDTPVKRFSSGMYVRLAFSVAAHLEPDILVVDEVLAVGDADFQKRSLGKMEEIGSSGRTVVFVSHNMATIARLCQRAILLDKGSVVDDGPADRVVARYLAGEHGTAAERSWADLAEAPGDESVRLRSVRVVDASSETVESIDVREPLGIEIVLDVLSDGLPFVPWIALFNEQGGHVFSAMDIDPAWRASREPGRYTATAWIPANLLNEGAMLVSVSLNTFMSGGRAQRRAAVDEAVVVSVYDPGEGDSARGHYHSHWSAPVRPLLQWATKVEPPVESVARGVPS